MNKWYMCPSGATVRIATSDIYEGDAIGNFNLQIRSFLKKNNIPCKLYAVNYEVDVDIDLYHYDELFDDVNDGDILLCHYSIYEERNTRLVDLKIPKAVYYHGITPPEYFELYDITTYENCAKGLQQARCFADFDYYISNSDYMLNQLLDAVCGDDLVKKHELSTRSNVCPPFINASQWDCESSNEIELPEGDLSLLYVGRVAPHKSVHELFDLLRSLVDKGQDASLRIVGGCAAPKYCEELDDLLDREYSTIKHRIKFYGHVSQSELKYLYESSDVFVTMSEHEGFCVPLVEAMRFSLPVLAKGRAAIPGTLSGSGMVFYDADYDVLADYVMSLLDEKVKKDALDRQDAVYQKILETSNGKMILSILEKLIQKHYFNKTI